MYKKILLKNLIGRDDLEDLDLDGRYYQNECYRKRFGGCGLHSSGTE